MSLTTQARRAHPLNRSLPPVIGSNYSGPAMDRPCLRQMPREWVLDTGPKPESVVLPVLGIIAAVLFACVVIAQIMGRIAP